MKDLGLTTANQNRTFNKKCNLKGAGSKAPQTITDGKDLGPNATNTIGGTKVTSNPISPSAVAQNRG